MASVNDSGAAADQESQPPTRSLSRNGRMVVFHSLATNLVDGIQNGVTQVYARDLWTRSTHRVSEGSNGPADKGATSLGVSADGTRFLFRTPAANLVPDGTTNLIQVFLFDAATGGVSMVSVNSAGAPAAKGTGVDGVLSEDGLKVVFESSSLNLDPLKDGSRADHGHRDLFLHDTTTGTTGLLTRSHNGLDPANGENYLPSISTDGSVVAFASRATNLVTGDTNGRDDVFLWTAGTITRLVGSDGAQLNQNAGSPTLSGNGRYLAFTSGATNVVPSSADGQGGLYIFDRVTQTYERHVLLHQNGSPAGFAIGDITPDGRHIALTAGDLLASNDTDGAFDVYRFDRLTNLVELVSLSQTGTNAPGTAWKGSLNESGSLAAFQSFPSLQATSNATWQVYTRGDHAVPRHITRDASDLFGRPRHSFYPGDPVNSATGNFIDATTDLVLPEHVPGMSLERSYNSLDASSGVLGVGWSHPFDGRLTGEASGAVTYRAPDGRRVVFETDGAGGYVEPLEFPASLAAVPEGGWRLIYRDGSANLFNVDGLPLSHSDNAGQTVTYTLDTGRIATATSSLGYTLAAAYDTNGRMETLTSSDGRVVRYSYTPAGALQSVSMDGVGQLFRYEHDASSRISKTRNGADALVVSNVFDSLGRVLSQTSPQGDTITFAYDDFYGRTTVTWVGSGQTVTFEHDENGRVTRVIDPLGEVAERTYDSEGNLTTGTERGGGSVSQTFDAAGNLLTRGEPAGGTHTWTYDSANRVTSYTDPTSAVTTYAYTGDSRIPSAVTDAEGAVTSLTESDGLVTAVQHADGLVTSFDYDVAGNVTSVTDPAGKATTMTYDDGGRLLTATTPLGHTSSNSYDDGGRLETSTDAAGKTTSYAYDAAGRLAQVTDPLGGTRKHTYTANGSPLSETDELGKVTTYQYDSSERLTKIVRPGNAETTVVPGPLGRVASVTSPSGVSTSYTYDAEGNILTETSPAGTTTYAYDGRGQVLSSTDPLNRTTTYAYDLMGRLLSATDPAAATTSYGYDGVGRLIRSQTPLGHATLRRYTPAGRLDEIEDPLGNISAHAYDAAGRLSSLTSPEGGITAFAYDDDGREVSRTSPAGLMATSSYDAVGRVLSITGPAGDVTSRTYTPRGELASLTDAVGGVRQFSYDLAGRLTKAIAANGGETLYGYDDRGNRTTQINARGGVDSWTYDLADRVTTWTDPVSKVTSYSYDTAGRLHVVTDPTARSTTHSYDAAGQLLAKTYGDGSADSFTYDPAGRRATMSNAGGTTAFAWDADGRLEQITDPDSTTLGYSYNAATRRTSVTYPGGATASYAYDADGRLTQVGHPSLTSPITYTHDADGRVLSELMPGVARTWSYDNGRLHAYQDTRGGTARTWNVTRDPAGRITAETRSDGTVGRYKYDIAGQLLEASQRNGSGGTDTVYEYDLTGNRVSERTNELVQTHHTYDAANRLNQTVTRLVGLVDGARTDYAYDTAGRVTVRAARNLTGALLGGEEWAYGPSGRVASHSVLDDSGSPSVTDTRRHDPDGRLIGVDTTPTGGTTDPTALRWDPTADVDQVVQIKRGAVPAELVYGVDRALLVQNGAAAPFLHDIYGSALTTPATNSLVRAGAYDPFGVPAGTGGTEPSFGYRGELHVGGDVHLRARDYDPATGRFTSKDPLEGVPGEVLAANPYPYAANDPLNMIDPLGERPFTDIDFRTPADSCPWFRHAPLIGDDYCRGFLTMSPRSQTLFRDAINWLPVALGGVVVGGAIAGSFGGGLALPISTGAGTAWRIGQNPAFHRITPAQAAELVRRAQPIGHALKSDAFHRAPSFVVNDIATKASIFQVPSQHGQRLLIQMPGAVNGTPGRFEWLLDSSGRLIHQLFVKGGTINGRVTQP